MYKDKQVTQYKQIVLDNIIKGMSISKMVAQNLIPDDNLVYKWLNNDTQFKDNYARARLEQVEYYGEKIENVVKELKEDNEPSREKTDIARLEIDSLKWIAARMLPKKYGANTVNNTNIQIVQPVTGMTILDELPTIDQEETEES